MELIITEKPSAALKVAAALGKPEKDNIKGVPYYKVEHDGRTIMVGSAAGHLYGLAEKEKTKNFAYPVFDIEWVPTYEVHRGSAFTKRYVEALQALAKKADVFTIATDYDIEGEVIGLNIIRFACGKKDARRMKFSTLTKEDLVEAYEHAQATLDWGQAEAGETRHYLDYYYGINLSRALTRAIKTAGMFKILSTGRVQGPALKLLSDREREIAAFVPVPFWQIPLLGAMKGAQFEGMHTEEKFWEKSKSELSFAKVKDAKVGAVKQVERAEFRQLPPHPFDLTTLQTEAYRVAGVNPKATLEIAQELYTAGYISYPRTSSQQLPEKLGFHKILNGLAKQAVYGDIVKQVLKTSLKPHNGKKTDPAHPAIYPTGITPRGLEGRGAKVYDLIVKRFFSTFGEPAVRESVTVSIDISGEPFVTKGTRTVKPNWHEWYAPFVKLEEIDLPPMVAGDRIDVVKLSFEEKATQPPKRFTPSSIIRELEKRNLGTKATRAEIISTLAERNYVTGESIEVTELGLKLIDILEKNIPAICEEDLTRSFEEDMEAIRAGTKKEEQVLSVAREALQKILHAFQEKEKIIGEQLKTTFSETRIALTRVGKCPNCAEGHIVLRKGRFGRFIACDKYPECKTTFSLPRTGGVEVLD